MGLGNEAWSELGSLRSQAHDLRLQLRFAEVGFPPSNLGNDPQELESQQFAAMPQLETPSPTCSASLHGSKPHSLIADRMPVAPAALAAAAALLVLDATIGASLPGIQGLEEHAEVLRKMFETQGMPNGDIVRKTWHYVQELERLNERWTAARKVHLQGTDIGDFSAPIELPAEDRSVPSWVRIVSQASCAEDQLRILAARLRVVQRECRRTSQ